MNRRLSRRIATSRDAGFALVWFGLTLLILLAMAGAAVDLWNWWYNGNQQQRAADSAALGGAPFLPADQSSARATAIDIAEANGVDVSELLIETASDDPTLEANQMRVTVRRSVATRFLQFVGVGDANVSRSAVAEYTSRLPMGSPEQFLGRDPERGQNPGFWISVSGRNESKVGGDRYQNFPCGAAYVFNCNGGSSTEYSNQGYAFSVQLDSAPTGDLVIQAYDPIHADAGAQDCTNTTRLPPAEYTALLPALEFRYGPGTPANDPNVAARYAPGDQIYCSGDVGGGNNNNNVTANVTTFIVREPDTTQADDYDNPPLDVTTNTPDSGCTRQFRAIDLSNPLGGTFTIYQVLTGLAGEPRAAAAQPMYRQWVTLCTIPAATAQGWYDSGLRSVIVQVRSNADLNAPFTTSTNARAGRNHFALRAGYGTAVTPSGVSIYALGRLPLHNGASGNSTTEFFLTRVPPGNAGRTLSLDFYDVADSGGTVDFEIVPPAGFGGSFTDCSFVRLAGNNNGTNSDVGLGAGVTATGCRLTGMTNATYNGRLAEVRVRVPTTYTCNVADPLDCWIKVRVTYNVGSGQVFDHTVWDAGVVGEPVRLIE